MPTKKGWFEELTKNTCGYDEPLLKAAGEAGRGIKRCLVHEEALAEDLVNYCTGKPIKKAKNKEHIEAAIAGKVQLPLPIYYAALWDIPEDNPKAKIVLELIAKNLQGAVEDLHHVVRFYKAGEDAEPDVGRFGEIKGFIGAKNAIKEFLKDL